MAVTLEQIVGYLKNADFKHHHDIENEVVVLITGDEDSTYAHFIRARDDGKIFEWQMEIIDENKKPLKIKGHKYISQVLSHLLFLNYETKFGTWEYNPQDGGIHLTVEIPLEDALMTEKQFNRIKGYMVNDGDDHVDEILHILETGEVPKDETADIIAQLEARLAELEAKKKEFLGEDSDEDGI